MIIKGHSRYEALKQLGCDLVPCIISEDDAKQALEERLVDNRVSEESRWDKNKLSYEIREMQVGIRELNLNLPFTQITPLDVANVKSNHIANAERDMIYDLDTYNKRQQSDLIECHCDGCGEIFFISYKEVQKYV